jgi:hypothetical protein
MNAGARKILTQINLTVFGKLFGFMHMLFITQIHESSYRNISRTSVTNCFIRGNEEITRHTYTTEQATRNNTPVFGNGTQLK